MSFFDQGVNVFRRKVGQTFRKKLGNYNYKIGKIGYHKNPGHIDLQTKEQLKKKGEIKQIHRLERDSKRVFGVQGKRSFIFDVNKLPFYDVPSLNGFNLKPYVSVHTPKIEKQYMNQINQLNDYTLEENFDRENQEKIAVPTTYGGDKLDSDIGEHRMIEEGQHK
ncbi:hypothetical protein PPERSA_04321 [Pseudocohnilembus persalinus]|uniref:Uncharacterized protein n=1 Tax=Pseudocohnilembus persalinus TaxID=266149 RepID=A0A0V0QR34_PSEPJ|nr:hypothetical protein PPERSA_04321 [Pseudocohnilembus persalinus]|eukprot:KRX04506.1 hypothetical protein PPERSA_04321 [Pseudocohnilembus persalinus]